MSVDQLWRLHEQLVVELGRKIAAEKATLEQRLRKLGFVGPGAKIDRSRRPYPKVYPKYRNPKDPSETWAGRWQAAALANGSVAHGQEAGRLSDPPAIRA